MTPTWTRDDFLPRVNLPRNERRKAVKAAGGIRQFKRKQKLARQLQRDWEEAGHATYPNRTIGDFR